MVRRSRRNAVGERRGTSSSVWVAGRRFGTAGDRIRPTGDPAVRVAQWVSAFDANGITASICGANFGSALQQVATRIGTLLAAGGGSGGGPGPIPSCATGAGGGRGGSGGGAGTGGSVGGGTGASTGADASTDGGAGPKGGGCGCRTGGAPTAPPGLAFAILALLWRRRWKDQFRLP
jgi:MYXO-CTERM domain-containing protein